MMETQRLAAQAAEVSQQLATISPLAKAASIATEENQRLRLVLAAQAEGLAKASGNMLGATATPPPKKAAFTPREVA